MGHDRAGINARTLLQIALGLALASLPITVLIVLYGGELGPAGAATLWGGVLIFINKALDRAARMSKTGLEKGG